MGMTTSERLFTPGPMHWRHLDVAAAAQLWDELVDWVEWLRHRYGLPHTKLPGCWPHHPVAVEELTALMSAHTAAYQALTTKTGAVVRYHDQMIVWHRLEMWSCIERIRANAAVGDCTTDQCNARPRALTPLTPAIREVIENDLRDRPIAPDARSLDESVMARLIQEGVAVAADDGIRFDDALWDFDHNHSTFYRRDDS